MVLQGNRTNIGSGREVMLVPARCVAHGLYEVGINKLSKMRDQILNVLRSKLLNTLGLISLTQCSRDRSLCGLYLKLGTQILKGLLSCMTSSWSLP